MNKIAPPGCRVLARREKRAGSSTGPALGSLFIVYAVALSIFSSSANGAENRSEPLPLTLSTCVAFFKETLGKRPTEVHKDCVVFYEGEWATRSRYRHSVITVDQSDDDLAITFCITDDRGANWIERFIRGPFFAEVESRRLAGLLEFAGNNSARVGRFDVKMFKAVVRHTEVVVLSFRNAEKPGD